MVDVPKATGSNLAKIYCVSAYLTHGMIPIHTVQHWVDHLEGLVNLLSNLRASQDNLAADEDEKHDLWLDHTIDLQGVE